MLPFCVVAQQDTSILYRIKTVHNQVLRADGSISWKTDTIKYGVPFEIKFQKRKASVCQDYVLISDSVVWATDVYSYSFATAISVDGYGAYRVSRSEMHGTGRKFQYPYYELVNGSKLTWIENSVIWEFPIVKGKGKIIVFDID